MRKLFDNPYKSEVIFIHAMLNVTSDMRSSKTDVSWHFLNAVNVLILKKAALLALRMAEDRGNQYEAMALLAAENMSMTSDEKKKFIDDMLRTSDEGLEAMAMVNLALKHIEDNHTDEGVDDDIH